jgi:hypothetical protein
MIACAKTNSTHIWVSSRREQAGKQHRFLIWQLVQEAIEYHILYVMVQPGATSDTPVGSAGRRAARPLRPPLILFRRFMRDG